MVEVMQQGRGTRWCSTVGSTVVGNRHRVTARRTRGDAVGPGAANTQITRCCHCATARAIESARATFGTAPPPFAGAINLCVAHSTRAHR